MAKERLVTEVPFTRTLGVMNPYDGLPPGKRIVSLFPEHGKFYLAGVRTFLTDDETDLRITILHPRTGEALLAPDGSYRFRDVQAVQLNPEFRSKRYIQCASYEDLFVPIWGTVHDPSDLEPAYCSKDQPLVLEVEGDAVLSLTVMGSDYYTVTRWPEKTNPLGPWPESLGEFRGPYSTQRITSVSGHDQPSCGSWQLSSVSGHDQPSCGSWQLSGQQHLPDRSIALRFSVPVKTGKLSIETSSYFCPKFVRLRGDGTLVQAWVDPVRNILAGPVALEYFADRGGHPASPRAQIASDDDSLDDSSDGPPVDWPVFGPDQPLCLEIEEAEPESLLHVVLTGVALTHPCYPGFGPMATAPLWPTARFRYADEEGWKTATVVDYATRGGSMSPGHAKSHEGRAGTRDQ